MQIHCCDESYDELVAHCQSRAMSLDPSFGCFGFLYPSDGDAAVAGWGLVVGERS